MNFSSKLLENAVSEFAKLPGIGQKTALRLVLSLLKRDLADVEAFGQAILLLKRNIKHCSICYNISDQPVCEICSSAKRDKETICVVEDARDVMAIENTSQFFGVYHVLGGLISPMDGIGPSDLFIDALVQRCNESPVKEIILGLSANMEGDTTIFYLYKRLKDLQIPITTIARGISFGGELEYADEITLGRSIARRVPYESTITG